MHPELTGNYGVWFNTYLPMLCECITNDPDYAYTKETCRNVHELAHKITLGLVKGSASKDSKAVKLTCKKLGIKHTYKAIQEFICTPLESA